MIEPNLKRSGLSPRLVSLKTSLKLKGVLAAYIENNYKFEFLLTF